MLSGGRAAVGNLGSAASAWTDGAADGELYEDFLTNLLAQDVLGARGDAELGAVTPGDSQAASSTLPTERARPTHRSESGAADMSTVSYATDKAEFDALRKLGIGDLPLSIGDYVALKHGDAERWNEFVRRATRQNPQAVEVLQGRALPDGDAAAEGYRSTEGEEDAERRSGDTDAGKSLTGEQADDTLENEESNPSSKINRWRNISDEEMPKAVAQFIKESVPTAYRESVRSAFTDEIRVSVLEEDTIVYRYYGGSSASLSYWFSPKLVSDPIRELALPPLNTAEYVDRYLLPEGTAIWEGRVKEMFGHTGGGLQYYVPDKTVPIRLG